jgi:hypothetical protein
MSEGELSNFQIDNICKLMSGYGGCISKDQLPSNITNKFYVVNMQNHSGGGTHWVLLYNCKQNLIIYFDSYGEPPPRQIQTYMNQTGKQQQISQEEIQQLNSAWCGEYFIEVAQKLNAGQQLSTIIKDFSTNPDVNDSNMKREARGILSMHRGRKDSGGGGISLRIKTCRGRGSVGRKWVNPF